MFITRELNLKVSRDMWGNTEYYEIGDEVTILCNNDNVYVGEIMDIGKLKIYIECENGEEVTINYSDIKNIADTNWLAGGDIREN